MRKLVLAFVVLAAALVLPGHARAIGPCGLPTTKPLWIDFGTPGPITRVFGKPGVVLGASTGDFPAKLRQTGAKTVYWDMNLNRRVGTPMAPADPAGIIEKADRLLAFAATQSGCDAPRIVLNELFGAALETPWSATNAQYRANVLALVRRLAERGAKSYLLLPARPYTGSEDAAAWWREVARYADLVAEVYFPAPAVHRLGPILANRRIRTAMRQRIAALAAIGIPAARQGVVLGFQTSKGSGGREGLEPAAAWFDIVKWQTLSAKHVARETGLGSVISWGWGSYRPSAHDDEKIPTACVYLWSRDPRLCNGPAAAGDGFDADLTEGQIVMPAAAQCLVGKRSITRGDLSALQRVTGDRDVAYAMLLARVAESPYAAVTTARVLAAERGVIASRFRGSRSAYLAALRRARASVGLARAALAEELRRVAVEKRLRARQPTAGEVNAFYTAYPDLLVRRVEATPAPWWLGRRKVGLALQRLAPEQIFAAPAGRRLVVRGLDATYAVRALGDVQALGALPLVTARPAISAALFAFTRRSAFEAWSVRRQDAALRSAICRRDDLPDAGTVRATNYLPFLSLIG